MRYLRSDREPNNNVQPWPRWIVYTLGSGPLGRRVGQLGGLLEQRSMSEVCVGSCTHPVVTKDLKKDGTSRTFFEFAFL